VHKDPHRRLFLRAGFAVFLLSLLAHGQKVGLFTSNPAGPSEPETHAAFDRDIQRARIQGSLFTEGGPPFSVHAHIVSRYALHAAGEGSYEEDWASSSLWQRRITMPDDDEVEWKNGDGPVLLSDTAGFQPIRMKQMRDMVMLHLPSLASTAKLKIWPCGSVLI
jgi:hypothetical protein